MKMDFRISEKILSIFNTIAEKGFYCPPYGDQEPASKTLLEHGICEWRKDFKGIHLTDKGKELIDQFNS